LVAVWDAVGLIKKRNKDMAYIRSHRGKFLF